MTLAIRGSSQQYLANLDRTQAQLQKAQAQASSGLRLQQVSDDPGAIGGIYQLQSQISLNQQTQTNLTRTQTDLNSADQALQSASTVIENALSLAAQGANSTAGAQDRANIAQQVGALQQTLLGLSQTTVNGRYIFSGDRDTEPTYQLDPTQASGMKQLISPSATRSIMDVNGTPIAVAKTAQDIFDARDNAGVPVAGNVFVAINSLLTSLQNNDQAGISGATDLLKAADQTVNSHLSFYGAAQNQVSNAITIAQRFLLQDQSDLGQKQDANLPAAALALTQAETQQQASLSVEAKIQQTPNLFNYLA